MPGTEKKRKLSVLIVLVVVGIVVWRMAPMFLPVYKWNHVNFKKIAENTGKPQAELEQVFTVIMRYRPRGDSNKDPAGWQILDMDPEWGDCSTDAWPKEYEDYMYLHCIVMSDRTGTKPSGLTVGEFFYDRYFTCKAQRLPPGALKQKGPRPVLLYDASTLTPLNRGDLLNYENNPGKWDNHDEFDGTYDDEWEPPVDIPEELPEDEETE